MTQIVKAFLLGVSLLAASVVYGATLDLNSASAEQIAEAMTGVGKAKAEAIVLDREKNGRFKSIDDLARVKGIGSSTIDKNRDKVTVGQVDASTPIAQKK